jgi:thioredoxin 1
MSSAEITHTSDAAFETDVLKSDGPVLVDFWAEWCGPCKMIAPILEEAAGRYAGRMRIAKLNVDENGASAAKFNIRSIPTLLLFKNGEVVARKVGAVSQSHLHAFLDGQLRGAA